MAIKQRGYPQIVFGLIQSSVNLSNSKIIIYRGTPLTGDQYVDRATHSADEIMQLTWNTDYQFAVNFNQLVPDMSLLETSPNLTKNASITGTATWFAIVTPNDQAVMCGTVSGQNGSGDLWVSDVNAVAGQPITVTDFEFSVNYTA